MHAGQSVLQYRLAVPSQQAVGLHTCVGFPLSFDEELREVALALSIGERLLIGWPAQKAGLSVMTHVWYNDISRPIGTRTI